MADSQAAEKQAQTAPDPVPVEPAAPPRWVAWAGRRPFPLLALLGLLLWLPGILSLPPLDRDESRFAQSSRQMVQTGNWVDIRLGHVPRYKKPVGIYWLQAAATSIGGGGRDDQIWTYRLPSLFGAIAASWLTVWAALAVTGAEAAFLAGLLMLGSVLLTAEASIATTTVLGLLAWDFWRRRKAATGDPVLDWLKNLKLVKGFFLTLLLISPWLIAITIQSQGAFLEQS